MLSWDLARISGKVRRQKKNNKDNNFILSPGSAKIYDVLGQKIS